jgi:hypothetical protein
MSEVIFIELDGTPESLQKAKDLIISLHNFPDNDYELRFGSDHLEQLVEMVEYLASIGAVKGAVAD